MSRFDESGVAKNLLGSASPLSPESGGEIFLLGGPPLGTSVESPKSARSCVYTGSGGNALEPIRSWGERRKKSPTHDAAATKSVSKK